MKTKYAWCLVLLMSLSTVVRAQQVHPMDPKNERSFWNHVKNTLSNEDLLKAKQNSSKLGSTITSSWNGVEMQVSAKNEYAYDNDQLVSDERFLMVESEWAEDWKTEYVYSNGLLSSITNLNYDFGSGAYVPVDQYQFGYHMIDGQPRLLLELYREWEVGMGWVAVHKSEYEYENGHISGGSDYNWETTQWVEMERFTSTFANDTTYITYFEFDSENWVEYSRELYPNLTLGELFEFFAEIATEINYGLTYLSLELPDFIYQEKMDNVWVNIEGQQTEDYYDVWDGKLKMREIQHLYWNEDWVVSYNNEIWYNSKVNPDSATVYVFLEEGKQPAGQEIYTYNDESQLVEVDYLQNIGFGLNVYSTTVLNWEVGTSNEPTLDIVSYRLNPAYPNPFNPSTNITYSMDRAGEVQISVYDVLGRHITTLFNGFQSAGEYKVQFDASSLSSGLYIVRMVAADYQKSQMITLLK